VNFDVDLLDHAGGRVRLRALYDLDACRGETALLAKPEDVYARTGCDGGEEKLERCRSTGRGRLICGDGQPLKVGIHAGATGKVDKYFHSQISFKYLF
jgi:hypothetical protein